MEEERSVLPDGWEWTTLQETGNIVSGGTPSTSDPDNFDGDIPWITPADLSGYRDKYISKGRKSITQKGLSSSSATLFPAGSVLFSSRAPIGYVAIASNPVSTNQGFKSITPKQTVFSDFLYYYLKSIKELAESQASGTTFLEISKSRFSQLPIPLPPLPIQHLIVAKIEELFTQLDAAEAALKRAKANLRRYRQSLLQAAVTGELTREWREAHKDELEPASELLQRIRAERRARWAEDLCAKGKDPDRVKYEEPQGVDVDGLPELPEGWEWITSNTVFYFVTSGSRGWAQYYSDSGLIFLRIGNLDHGTIGLDLSDIQRVSPPEGAEGVRTKVNPNDILVSITADVGMIGLVPEDLGETYINQHISLARPVTSINPKFIAWFLTSKSGYEQLRGLQRGATKMGLGLDDIKSVNIPLPFLEEQDQIVKKIEEEFSLMDRMEKTILQSLNHIGRLRQSILQSAFSGQLV